MLFNHFYIIQTYLVIELINYFYYLNIFYECNF